MIDEQAAPKKVVISLVARLNATRMRVQSINEEVGAEIEAAVKKQHLHVGALKLITKLSRMKEQRRDEFLRTFNIYLDYAKDAGVFGDEHVADLASDEEEGARAFN